MLLDVLGHLTALHSHVLHAARFPLPGTHRTRGSARPHCAHATHRASKAGNPLAPNALNCLHKISLQRRPRGRVVWPLRSSKEDWAGAATGLGKIVPAKGCNYRSGLSRQTPTCLPWWLRLLKEQLLSTRGTKISAHRAMNNCDRDCLETLRVFARLMEESILTTYRGASYQQQTTFASLRFVPGAAESGTARRLVGAGTPLQEVATNGCCSDHPRPKPIMTLHAQTPETGWSFLEPFQFSPLLSTRTIDIQSQG